MRNFTRFKTVILLITVFIFYTCIDPYNPQLAEYDSLMVVEGMITDLNTPYNVTLSRTFKDTNVTPVKISDASVFITDDSGNNFTLQNEGNGTYKTDSTEFRGTVGRTYVLHITTSDDSRYESEPYMMQSVADIDSIYFEKDQRLVSNGTDIQKGISIYLDSKQGDANQYYRWDYDETWKFKVPYPKLYIYANCEVIYQVPYVENDYCWKNGKSTEVITASAQSGDAGKILKKPISFIASDQSDRLMLEYSVLIKQYSISNNEYEFWNNIEKINAAGGDIFSAQPYTVISNIHNIKDPGEMVLGYFQVSAVKEKRKFISFNDIAGLQLPFYHYPCERFEIGCVNPFIPDYCEEFNSIYRQYTISNNCYFIEPLFVSGTVLDKLVFARPECANCQVTGSIKKPDFWVDLN
jgi:hypothetical protein